MCCGKAGKVQSPMGTFISCPDGQKQFAPDALVIAQKFGLDLCNLTGTGMNGTVLRQDVDRALGR